MREIRGVHCRDESARKASVILGTARVIEKGQLAVYISKMKIFLFSVMAALASDY